MRNTFVYVAELIAILAIFMVGSLYLILFW